LHEDLLFGLIDGMMTIDARQAGQAGAGQSKGNAMQGPVRSRGSLSLVPEYGFLCYFGCIASQDEVRLLLLSLYLLFALRNEGPHVGMASGTASPFRMQHLESENRIMWRTGKANLMVSIVNRLRRSLADFESASSAAGHT
jgi:hypothetical protein